MRSSRQLHIAIVGAGRVGTVLGRMFVEHGARITCVVSRTLASAKRTARFLDCTNPSTDLGAIPASTRVVYITTPHSAVEEVARALARVESLKKTGLSVCHASGMLTAAALAPLAEQGAVTFSFHPLQTFPRDFPARKIMPRARGIYYGVDGDARGLKMARLLARALGGKIIVIPPDLRVFYHAACVLASNHLTAMLAILDVMYRKIGPADTGFFKVFKPIIMATLANIEATSPAEALSGPVARGGVETVARHFDALSHYAPALIPYFAAMSTETVTLASRKGSITTAQAEALMQLIRSHVGTPLAQEENR